MKRKMNRKLSSLDYILRKAYWKLSIYKPSYLIFASILMGAAIFLLGGGLYDLTETNLWPYWISGTGQIVFFYPGDLNRQFLGGSIIVMILYALGTSGLLMVYRSARYVHNPRQATILLSIGIVFILIAFILMESIIYNYKIYFGS